MFWSWWREKKRSQEYLTLFFTKLASKGSCWKKLENPGVEKEKKSEFSQLWSIDCCWKRPFGHIGALTAMLKTL